MDNTQLRLSLRPYKENQIALLDACVKDVKVWMTDYFLLLNLSLLISSTFGQSVNISSLLPLTLSDLLLQRFNISLPLVTCKDHSSHGYPKYKA